MGCMGVHTAISHACSVKARDGNIALIMEKILAQFYGLHRFLYAEHGGNS